jgi:hypothetical protein
VTHIAYLVKYAPTRDCGMNLMLLKLLDEGKPDLKAYTLAALISERALIYVHLILIVD